MNTVHAQRLLTLADFLETLPEEQFDMDIWFEKTSCGTAGCVLGWAGTIPEFQTLGLKTNSYDNFVRYTPILPTDVNTLHAIDGWEDCDSTMGSIAGMAFFGLTHEERHWLFLDPAEAATPTDAANKIRTLVGKYFPEGVK